MRQQHIVRVRFHDALESECEEFKNVLSHVGTPQQVSFEHQRDGVGMIVVTLSTNLTSAAIDRFLLREHPNVAHVSFDKPKEECHDCQTV